jgi:transposase
VPDQWNTPIVRAYYLKEAFQMFWDYKQPKRARTTWRNGCVRPGAHGWNCSRNSCAWLRGHLDGILAWTKHRLSSRAVEGMNNKIKSISHRSFGLRTPEHFIAAIYHCCARLPLPIER